MSGCAWQLTGNSGTAAGNEFLGTTDSQPLVIKTNNNEALRIDTDGNVGIGTASFTEKLSVAGIVESTVRSLHAAQMLGRLPCRLLRLGTG